MNDHTRSISTNQGAITVKRCGCGGIHVCLGGISINLAQDTARLLKEELEKVCTLDNTSLRIVNSTRSETH